MQFLSENWQDIRRYYEGTYVKFNEFGDRLFAIQHVDSNKVVGIDEDRTDFILHLDNYNPYTVDYILPHKTVFQYKDQAHLISRIPARQYRRGLCCDNTQICRVTDGQRVSIDFPILKAFVNKQSYASFREAFNSKEKRKSIALSPRLSFVRANGAIQVDHTVVATYNYNEKKITMVSPLFLPEIMQHMVDHNDVYEVIK